MRAYLRRWYLPLLAEGIYLVPNVFLKRILLCSQRPGSSLMRSIKTLPRNPMWKTVWSVCFFVENKNNHNYRLLPLKMLSIDGWQGFTSFFFSSSFFYLSPITIHSTPSHTTHTFPCPSPHPLAISDGIAMLALLVVSILHSHNASLALPHYTR